jgi:hypothetical protein
MDGFRPLRKAPGAVAGLAAAGVGLWALAWRNVISNWTFTAALIVLIIGGSQLIMRLLPDRFIEERRIALGEDLDHVGLGTSFVSTDRERFDAGLGLPPILSPVLNPDRRAHAAS